MFVIHGHAQRSRKSPTSAQGPRPRCDRSQPCAQSFSAPRLRCHATAFRNCHTQRASTIRARCLVTAHPRTSQIKEGSHFLGVMAVSAARLSLTARSRAIISSVTQSALGPDNREAAGGTPPVILILPFASCGAPCQSLISRGDLVQTFPALRVRFAVGEGSAVFGQLVPNHGRG